MSIPVWIVMGLLIGFVADKVANDDVRCFLFDVLPGGVGAFLGGFLLRRFVQPEPWS